MLKKIFVRAYFQTVKAVRFTYDEIQNCSSNLNAKIEEAYGSHGLGLAIVSGIPNYSKMRLQLLPLAQKLAVQPQEYLKTLERPESFYSKGWSCGVEQFKGKFDKSKGSFYNNPNYDKCQELGKEYEHLMKKGSLIRIENVWPNRIPELEGAFKNLGRLMVDTGALLSYHIDKYIFSKCNTYEMGKLYRFVRTGDSHVGRLLHYYDGPNTDEWCGWHNDHSALTALTCPIYMHNDKIVDYTDQEGGLLAKNRYAEIMKVGMDPDCLAFQIGETAQIVSGGIVEATPHCVVKSDETVRRQLNRNTFAVFMGPLFNEVLNVPKGIDKDNALNKPAYNIPALLGRWDENMTFLEYSANSLKAYS
ncbi:unnamed protein product [Paramecium primaurelia]|uniref:Non-haem dioxygenase N-terminal domain-containing protein n=1 Tax=Paramecium primaurelia TaxID=5886 RepID=A0A8S1JPM7_PARPR|nr:unnamed protein product [Paramecium primaurelia]